MPDKMLERAREFCEHNHIHNGSVNGLARKFRSIRREALEELRDMVYAHVCHGEFCHGGRYECAVSIYEEIRELIEREGKCL